MFDVIVGSCGIVQRPGEGEDLVGIAGQPCRGGGTMGYGAVGRGFPIVSFQEKYLADKLEVLNLPLGFRYELCRWSRRKESCFFDRGDGVGLFARSGYGAANGGGEGRGGTEHFLEVKDSIFLRPMNRCRVLVLEWTEKERSYIP